MSFHLQAVRCAHDVLQIYVLCSRAANIQNM